MKMDAIPEGHPVIKMGRVGVLLVNLGTPDGTDFWSIRRYLKEFLSDRRVIEANPLIWQLILNVIILNVRPAKSAHAYKKIWLKESDESPLRAITRHQAEKLQLMAADQGQTHSEIVVEWAMRYGQPAIASKLATLRQQGCDRIAVLPLYPQYSATTTATVQDEVFRYMQTLRWQPTLRFAEPYYADSHYIQALANAYRQHLDTLDWVPEVLLTSFHGLPQVYLEKGDPYYCHCHKTMRLMRDALAMDETNLLLAFQSRFGPKQWLQPYMDDVIADLIKKGVKRIAVITPGFAADCVETLEEIDIGIREDFIQAGGTHFTLVPALNDSTLGVALLERLMAKTLAGWC